MEVRKISHRGREMGTQANPNKLPIYIIHNNAEVLI